MIRALIFGRIVVVFTVIAAIATGEQLDRDRGTLLIAEANSVFLTRPTGGKVLEIPHRSSGIRCPPSERHPYSYD